MADTPEMQPSDAGSEKSLELSDLPAYKEGENVKGGVYNSPAPSPSPTPSPTPTPSPICTTQGLSTCHVYDSQVDTFCQGKQNC